MNNLETRQMLIEVLSDLQNLCGSRQYLDIQSLPTQQEAQQTLDALLAPMINTCNAFGYISTEQKKSVIIQGIIEDDKFYGLNAQKIWKYLNSQSSKYYKEFAHQKEEPTANPVTYDELSPETKERVDGLLRLLQTDKGFRTVPVVTQAEIDAIKIDDLEERNGKESEAVKSGYHTNPELAEQHAKKIEWARLHTDLYTGKIKPGSPTYEEWTKQQTI